ncbi:MAG TPA: hypothetical protein ENI97_01890 [Gammaproteobacteria bacterium]|nr:hypothetical protein [Gammaproteobacteria bacterium]
MKTDSMTKLLKQHNAGISTVKANQCLLSLGLLEEKERPSTKYPEKMKKFKALTERGLIYGENKENQNSPGQTSPYYYEDRFAELLGLIRQALEE